jgi:signal transduction histidine kinase
VVEINIQGQNGSWVVSVKDYGEGIAEKDKIKIFNRLERVSKGSIKGTGLGLTIAKRIVAMHRGDIWVEDNPQGGSVFGVRLPKVQPRTVSYPPHG